MKRRTIHRWQWCYVTSSGEEITGYDPETLAGYRRMHAKRITEGKALGSFWRRRVSYAPWTTS